MNHVAVTWGGKYCKVRRELPVFLVYWTAVCDADGYTVGVTSPSSFLFPFFLPSFPFLSFFPPPYSLDTFHFTIVCSLSCDAWVKTNQSNIRHQAVECAGSRRNTRDGFELSRVAM
jgi:hypothetical protein